MLKDDNTGCCATVKCKMISHKKNITSRNIRQRSVHKKLN